MTTDVISVHFADGTVRLWDSPVARNQICRDSVATLEVR